MKKLLFVILPALVMSCTGGYKISGIVPEGVDSVTLKISDTAKICEQTVIPSADLAFSFSGKVDGLSRASVGMWVGEKLEYGVGFAMSNENIEVFPDTAAYNGLSVKGNISGQIIDEWNKAVYDSESEDCAFMIIDSLLTCNPADEFVPFFFNKVNYYFTLQQYDAMMAKIDPSLKENKYFVKNADHFECLRKTDVGQQFTDFTSLTVDGQPLQLSSLAGKGNWLLVDFWASWCSPCRAENPNVLAAYRKYHDKGFDILGVSLDKDSTKWVQAIEKDSLVWTNVSDLKMWDSESRIIYGINSIPANVLIAPDGIIAARGLRGDKLEKFLSEKLD